MTTLEACEYVLGKEMASEIIARDGMHAAVLAAMDYKPSDGPEVKAAIDLYLGSLKGD